MAMKAQQLFQDVENISQMIMVCEVHCAAEKKFLGNELDWYAILKVEVTADEAAIKKQYRKFALGLHPDKNKFPGAEAAFKLIGDAQRILLDQGKRSTHDMKRRVAVTRPAPAAAAGRQPQKPSSYPYVAVQNNFSGNFPGMNSQQQKPQPTQTGSINGRATFWTKCPYCTVKYQYYTEILHRTLQCQNCKKTFVAYASGAVQPESTMSQPKFPQQRVVLNPGALKVDQGSQPNISAGNAKAAFPPNAARTSEVRTEKVNGKKGRKQTVESSDSYDSDSSTEPEEDDMMLDDDADGLAGKKFDSQIKENLRRSGRRKQNVSYKENLSDEDDMVSPAKKAKSANVETEEVPKEDKSKFNNQSGLAGEVKEDKKAMEHGEGTSFGASSPNGMKKFGNGFDKERAKMDNHKTTVEAFADGATKNAKPDDDNSLPGEETTEPLLYNYADSEFYDFEKDKKEGCFSAGQIWAMYDTLDAMPRFYAQIRKVFSSGFKLRITWLEPDPDDDDEVKWVSEGLPVSCGNFRHGESENTEDRLMFSHKILWEKGISRNTFKIFPRKGETWAIFKDWNIKWKSNSDQKFKYEFVEILSEYAEGLGIRVAYLTKVKGFVSVFCKDGVGTRTSLIPCHELLRFSHRVPSSVLTGQEREGVPKGSFELDPACLPAHPEETVAAKDLKVENNGRDVNSSCSSSSENVMPTMGSKDALEIPETEFYNFDADKSPEKFDVGQIWALYSDEDGLPKYYGEIKKVQFKPFFEVRLKWLAFRPPHLVIQWLDRSMPTTCGTFKVNNKKGAASYTSTDTFSHKLNAKPTGTKDVYDILPRKGEIWALYRNWSPHIKCSDLENWEYDIVQVVEETLWHRKVLLLERVDGFNSVFKPKVEGGSDVTMDIPCVEQIRFSHQIPSFQLTNERDGRLRGFWEVDTAAFPVHYFYS
ncbi:hypothetical protein CCACVL1_28388 [Corchorus capsularis]|uniref:J domain-containing protein n=1 Tax=Corchorus capsularis TaxID=210143 RepID=A0A1R3G6U1_COCAP|nr:hypothetical protein CCACVL1_28388 [Corchorus capsularis]